LYHLAGEGEGNPLFHGGFKAGKFRQLLSG
jgi:hypothetical protein